MKVGCLCLLLCLVHLSLWREGSTLLKFPWGVNFRREGVLHHSVDRVWVVNKVSVPTITDLQINMEGFTIIRQMCPEPPKSTQMAQQRGSTRVAHNLWITNPLGPSKHSSRNYFTTNITHALCERMEPLLQLMQDNEVQAQSKLNRLLNSELDLVLKGQHHRQKRFIAAVAPILGKAVAPIIGGVAMMAVEKIGSWLSGKRHKAVKKGLEYLDTQQGLHRNELYQTREDLVMAGKYSAAAIEKMTLRLNSLQSQQQELAHWVKENYKPYEVYNKDLLVAFQMQVLLQLTAEAHGNIYKEMIDEVSQFLDATITLSQGYLPRELITPIRLRRMIQEVEQKVIAKHPNFKVAITDPNDYYDLKLVTFGTKGQDLVITFPVFLQHEDRQTLELFQVETVPVPVLDANEEMDTYTHIIPKKPYIAMAGEYFIELTTPDLFRCKKVHFQYYCEELFMLRHESQSTCNSALLFDSPQETVLQHCKIKVLYNGTTVRPAVLDGGNKIILANMAKDKELLCTVADPVGLPYPEDSSAIYFPRRLPKQTYLMLNREILCYCDIEANYHLVLQSIAGCPESNEPVVYEYTINQAFYTQFKELLDAVAYKMEEDGMVSLAPQPDFPVYLPADDKLIRDTELDIQKLQEYLNKTYPKRKGPNRPLGPTSLDEAMEEGFLDKLSVKVFNFVSGCLTFVMGMVLVWLVIQGTYLKTMVGGLALTAAPKGQAQVLFQPTTNPPPTPPLVTEEVYQLICHDPWITWTITSIFVTSLLVALIRFLHKVVITKGIVYTNKCELFLIISHACYYVPLKLVNTRGLIYNFSMEGQLTKTNTKLNRNNFGRDSLTVAWTQKVYNNISQLNMPSVVQIPFWYKAMVRDMLSQEDVTIHLMVKQGYNWHLVRVAQPPTQDAGQDIYATIG